MAYSSERLDQHESSVVPCVAADVARGVNRLLLAQGYSPILELPLANGRRLDVAALGPDGTVVGVEIKISLSDLASDGKWPEYLLFCDLFYFAVPPGFMQERLPAQIGLIVADRFGGAIVRASQRNTLNAARRRALTLRFARTAADRLARICDPNGF